MAPAAALAVALALAATPAPPEPSPDVRDEVRALLGAIHGGVPPERFRALGPGAEEALLELAREDGPPLRRVRALEALAGLGGSRAEEVHRDVAASASAPRAVRRGAVRGLARLAGPARATPELAALLERDPDPTVRAAAAEALAAVAPAEACARIRSQARAEPAAGRFRRAMSLCDRSRPSAVPRR
jgi:HEAT repeat protein